MLPKEKWHRIILVSPTSSQPTFNPIRKMIKYTFTEASEDVFNHIERMCAAAMRKGSKNPIPSPYRTLLIVDDCSAEKSTNRGRKGSYSKLANNARWLNLSIITITQNLSSISPSFRDNAEGLMLFHTLNQKEKEYIIQERNPFDNAKDMYAIMDSARQEPHDFLFQVMTTEGVFHYRNFDINLTIEKE